jgi:hypothetical protein
VGEVKLTYLVLKKIESSSNDGAGHGGLPLLRFFPSAFLCCLAHRLFCFFFLRSSVFSVLEMKELKR